MLKREYLLNRRTYIAAFGLLATVGGFVFLKLHKATALPAVGTVATSGPGQTPVAAATAPKDTSRWADFTAPAADTAKRFLSGESPFFAAKMGWPVKAPAPLPGAILPAKRIVAYYGNPLSKKMGILGELPPQQMLQRFEQQLAEWRKADPATPVQPALHLIAAVAQGEAGTSGKYRIIMRDSMIETVYGWAKSHGAIMFIDVQAGQDDIRQLVPKFDKFLMRPDVHLAIDPEFAMIRSGRVPGTKIGTMDASEINVVSEHLAELVRKYNLPTKVLIVHRFTRNMVTNARTIRVHPEVQVIMNMDGWGAPWLKRDSYKDYIVREPVEYTGFKLFYHNDTKKGDALLKPEEVLRLRPKPLYIQYQ